MDLDELRTVRRTEREKDSLQHLRGSFYEDVATYLSDLEAQRDRAVDGADDPFASPEVRRLTDEIETAREVAEAVYERRVGKIVKQASFAAADMQADRDGLTDREVELFDDLVARIKQNKSEVLSVLSGQMERSEGSSAPASDADITRELDTESSPSPHTDSTADEVRRPGSGGAEITQSSAVNNATPNGEDDPAAVDAGDVLAGAMGAEPAESSGDSSAEDTSTTNDDPFPPSDDSFGEPDGSDPHHDPAPDPDGGNPPDIDSGSASEDPTGDSPDGSNSHQSGTHQSDSHQSEPPTQRVEADQERPDSAKPSDASEQLQRTTVRITRDVGAILGADEREYDLAREDVVTLPTANAEPLVERDAAERLE